MKNKLKIQQKHFNNTLHNKFNTVYTYRVTQKKVYAFG